VLAVAILFIAGVSLVFGVSVTAAGAGVPLRRKLGPSPPASAHGGTGRAVQE
jgi:hypothetical protein